MDTDIDEIGRYLEDGWEIVGYDVCLLATGATTQYILLRKGNSLATGMVMIHGAKEIARGVSILTPKPVSTSKKGFFG